jgi:NAD(P)H-hydrate epimerase
MSSAKSKTATTPVTIDDALVRTLVPTRGEHSHKWGVGGVLIIGGSPGFIGAPALAAMGAGRSGAGIVSIASPRSAMGAIASIVPEASFMALPESDLGIGGDRAAERVRERLEKFKALVVGPGLGEDEYADAVMQGLTGWTETRKVAHLGFSVGRPSADESEHSQRNAIIGGETPTVLDADGLNWLAKQGEDWADRFAPQSLVLTPHVGEMSRLTGLEADEIIADAPAIAQKFAAAWKQTVVLKGSPTVVSDGSRLYAAPSSPPSLATAGTGDVFAGSIGAFLAQGLAPIDAAVLATWLGVKAAEQLQGRFGTLGLIATDLPLGIAEQLASLENAKGN